MVLLKQRIGALERKADGAYRFPPLSPAALEGLRRLKTGQCATDEPVLAGTTASNAEAIVKRGPAPKVGPATRRFLKQMRAARAVTKG